MFSFKNFITEAVQKQEIEHSGMPEKLHNFMLHLSSPSDPAGKSNKSLHEMTLNEMADFYDQLDEEERKRDYLDMGSKKSKLKFDPEKVAPAMRLPKTRALIDQARSDIPSENLHKRIANGLRSATESMRNESPEESRAKLREAKQVYRGFMTSRGYKGTPTLLGENLKTEKSSGEGVMTKGLFLAPHATSGLHGFDICPKASSQCREDCLGLTAGGNRAHADHSLSSKVYRTHFLAKHPEHFARILDNEIGNHTRSAKKEGMKAGIRLNGTSDLAWEKNAPHLFERHPETQFYDYTKMSNRVGRRDNPSNYHLTLSHTGTDHAESNDREVAKTLSRGHGVAMVYQRGKSVPKPTHVEDVKTGRRYPILNGDKDDNTFDRHESAGLSEGGQGQGVVSGLQLKGVKNEKAGVFANPVDKDGIIRINK
jgi:hypothetical protein